MATKITHTSYTQKDGYIWRKRTDGGTISISLQTRNDSEAISRAALMSIRFIELSAIQTPYDHLKTALKSYRDNLITQSQLEALRAIVANASTQQSNLSPVAASVALASSSAVSGHSLESVKEEWSNEIGRNWRPGTRSENLKKADRFIAWASSQGLTMVEQIKKSHISQYKDYLDEVLPAVSTRNVTLAQASSMLKFCCVQRDYIERNPCDGLAYKIGKSTTEKAAVADDDMSALKQTTGYTGNSMMKWAIEILAHTGMRIGELQQLTKSDYRVIAGVKVISLNEEDGKRLKTSSSKRNIPLCEKLLDMGIWDAKPVFNKLTSKDWSNRIGRLLTSVGSKATAHSFRVTVSDKLRDSGVQDSTRYFILGHASDVESDRVYRTHDPLIQMKEAVDLL